MVKSIRGEINVIDVEALKAFLVSTYGVQFFLQYLGGKAIDKLTDLATKKELTIEEKWLLLFDRTLQLLCEKRNWEYDDEAVSTFLNDGQLSFEKLNDNKYASECLYKLLGQSYKLDYGEDIINDWQECMQECLVQKEFDELFKKYGLAKLSEIEDFNKEILIFKNDVLKKIDTLEGDKDRWKEREEYRIAKEKEEELQVALQEVEDGEYEKAIERLKKVNVWSKDQGVKYTCYYKIAYCYSQLARNTSDYKTVIKWFEKAEEISSPERDDVVLLYRNIALVYIYIGMKENKIDNYNKSNSYFKKSLQYLSDDDHYFFSDIIIHIARNYMDMCDEISVSKANEYLDIAMSLMYSIFVNCDALSEEQAYVLFHNMARTYYHKGEKEGKNEYFSIAQDLYLSVLEMKYTKADNLRFAMTNENIAMAYQYDISKREENKRKAISYYKVAKGLYQAEEYYDCKRYINNINLDIATVYQGLYNIKRLDEDYQQAEEIIDQIIKGLDYMPNNSFSVRVFLAKMKLNILAAKINFNESEQYVARAQESEEMLDAIIDQVNYEKYKYSFEIFKCELKLVQINENTDKSEINKIIDKLEEIKSATSTGNVNISNYIDDLLKRCSQIIEQLYTA